MIKLLTGELKYNIITIISLIMLLLVAFIVMMIYTEDDLGFITAILTYSIVNTIFTTIWKERRFNRYVLLPVPKKTIAQFRILLIVVPFVLLLVVYFLISPMFTVTPISLKQLLAWSNVILFSYAVFFVFNDLLAGRTMQGKAINLRIILIIFLTGTMLLGLILYSNVSSGEALLPTNTLITFFQLLGTVQFHLILFVVNMVLFAAGIYTFKNRRQYLVSSS